MRLRSGEELTCRAVVGADGVSSAVAATLGVRPPNLAGYTAYRHDFADISTAPVLDRAAYGEELTVRHISGR